MWQPFLRLKIPTNCSMTSVKLVMEVLERFTMPEITSPMRHGWIFWNVQKKFNFDIDLTFSHIFSHENTIDGSMFNMIFCFDFCIKLPQYFIMSIWRAACLNLVLLFDLFDMQDDFFLLLYFFRISTSSFGEGIKSWFEALYNKVHNNSKD